MHSHGDDVHTTEMWNLTGKKPTIVWTELIWERKYESWVFNHFYLHAHMLTGTGTRHIPCPLSTKLAMVFAAFEERKKLALSPSFSAVEKVL